MPRCPNCKVKLGLVEVLFGKLDKVGCHSCGTKLKPNKVQNFIMIFLTCSISSYLVQKYRYSNFSTLLVILIVLLLPLMLFVTYLTSTFKPIE